MMSRGVIDEFRLSTVSGESTEGRTMIESGGHDEGNHLVQE